MYFFRQVDLNHTQYCNNWEVKLMIQSQPLNANQNLEQQLQIHKHNIECFMLALKMFGQTHSDSNVSYYKDFQVFQKNLIDYIVTGSNANYNLSVNSLSKLTDSFQAYQSDLKRK